MTTFYPHHEWHHADTTTIDRRRRPIGHSRAGRDSFRRLRRDRLTALSFAPDLTFGFDTGSAATLIARLAVAAAIVVPTLAERLARIR